MVDRRKGAGLAIGHLDCDAFFAAVEKRDDPSLRGRPVVIGGGRRGVVATACYVARTRGVHSAMPMFKALKACPDAVVLKPDIARYRVVSQAVRAIMAETAGVVEPISIDEAYLDLADAADPVARAVSLAIRIKREVGVTVSIGLGPNKFVAKLASDMDKPEGFTLLTLDAARRFLADKPARILRGVGAATAERLARDGFETVAAIRRAGEKKLTARYGAHGRLIFERAWANDDRAVAPPGPRKSVSSETTFAEDVADLEDLRAILARVAEKTAERAARAGVRGVTVILKLKRADHTTLTRSSTLSAPIGDEGALREVAGPLLAAAVSEGPFRLLGVGLSGLEPADDPVQESFPFDPAA